MELKQEAMDFASANSMKNCAMDLNMLSGGDTEGDEEEYDEMKQAMLSLCWCWSSREECPRKGVGKGGKSGNKDKVLQITMAWTGKTG